MPARGELSTGRCPRWAPALHASYEGGAAGLSRDSCDVGSQGRTGVIYGMSADTVHPMMRALAAAVRARVSVLLWGAPGVAKTSIIQSHGAAWGYHVETIASSNREPSDFLGLPIQAGDEVRYSPLAWAKRVVEADQAILFLDELTTARPPVQAAMLRILGERVAGEVELGDGVAIVAAANPPDIAVDGWDLSAPVANRLLHLDWHFDADSWLAGVVTNFEHEEVPGLDSILGKYDEATAVAERASVTAFLSARPDLILSVPKDPAAAGRGWPSPRSWTNAMNVMVQLPAGDEEARLLVLKGCVGEGAAIEYLSWLASSDLYDPREVLDDPSIVTWTDRPDRIFALTSAIAGIALADGTAKVWSSALTAMLSCAEAGRPDLALPTVRMLLGHAPKGAKPPAGLRDAFRDLLVRNGRWSD